MGLGSCLPLNFLGGFFVDLIDLNHWNMIDKANYRYWDFPIELFT